MQNNQLVRSDIDAFAKTFIDSKMFKDVASIAAAAVKIQAGQELGIAPFASMSGINIIMGKCSIGASLIAALIKSSQKYNYRILRHDDTICEIEMFEMGQSVGKTQFTAEDAKRAETKNMQKFPKSMLFARCISNAAKWYCADIFNGSVYVPEEIDTAPQTTVDVVHEEIKELPELPLVHTDSHNFEKIKDAVYNKGYALESYSTICRFTDEARNILTIPKQINQPLGTANY